MQTGDLVNVRQEVGCWSPPRYKERGVGIILSVIPTAPVDIGTAMDVNLGDNVVVALASGTTETFCEQSVEVINESR